MIHLHIKGDIAAAFKSADAFGVELTSITMRTKDNGFTECLASTIPECLPKVQRWFADASFDQLVPGFGYPVGTLLHFSEDLTLNPR